jgi:hypothetical protein
MLAMSKALIKINVDHVKIYNCVKGKLLYLFNDFKKNKAGMENIHVVNTYTGCPLNGIIKMCGIIEIR